MADEKIERIRELTIPDSVYSRKIVLVVGDPEVCRQRVEKRFNADIDTIDESNHGCFVRIADNKRSTYLMWLRRFDGGAQDVSVLAHEVLHLTFSVMKCVGIKFNSGSEEAFTYYLDSIVKHSMLALKKGKCKVKKT